MRVGGGGVRRRDWDVKGIWVKSRRTGEGTFGNWKGTSLGGMVSLTGHERRRVLGVGRENREG